LGARSVPIVARGDRFVFAQVIRDVVEFLGLKEDGGPALSPSELAQRYPHILETAIRLVRQMPDAALTRELPNRPRSYHVLLHHIFQIPTAFLDMEEKGGGLTRERLEVGPDPAMSSAEIAAFGEAVRHRFLAWWDSAKAQDFAQPVEAYFGEASRHEVLERTVWHSTQHTRQLASLLEGLGIAPDRPLGPADIKGLPLTERIWDEG
jgi:uncharacterized damage-inducible protein DinB